ncbi:hypothetical protein [Rhodococcus sovatensis]|uniref:hypothetical protein n=1 Tax=Rhodococcus sovatensis TaxID=1805840 RepID=UPI003BAEEBA9
MLAAWIVGLLVAGAGIGIAWPHLAVGAMTAVAEPGEGARASAAINTVQLIANAFGAALAGVLVNIGEPSTLHSAQLLLGTFAALAIVGVAVAARAARGELASLGLSPVPASDFGSREPDCNRGNT